MTSPLGVLAVLLLLAPPAAADGPTASLGDRLSWNARERTAAGTGAHVAGETESAVGAFDVAHRLRPDDPRTAFNAGTARIGHDAEGAESLLSAAARAASPDLAPSAWYNLGTARLAAGDAPGAVEALTEALRRAPGNDAAKHNLELAWRDVERQRRERQQDASAPGSPSPGEQREPTESRDDDSGPSGSRDGDGEQSAPEPQAPGKPVGDESGRSAGPGERPLPQFQDLPDMTAEQAAAILRAVEALERQQRREKALRAAAERAAVEVDW